MHKKVHNIHTHTHTHIYIYIYVCVCVCVCNAYNIRDAFRQVKFN